MQGLRQSDKKEYEIPITNCMTIFILFLAKFCYVAKKKKQSPSKSTKGYFGKNAPTKVFIFFREKCQKLTYLENEFWRWRSLEECKILYSISTFLSVL